MANGKLFSGLSGAASGATAGAQLGVPWGAAIGGGLGLAAGLMGGQDDQSSKYYDEIMARVNSIQIPGMDQLTFTPEELQYMGDFNPEELQNYVLQKSEMENINRDPRLRQEQMKALDAVSALADKGFSDEDMMAFNIARNNAAGEEQAKQQQILQNMQQRGQGGSGAELIARLTSNQNASNQLSNEQQKQAIAQAEARKQALSMLANQSGSLRSQDFGEESSIANAKDLVNRINNQNIQDVARTNTATKNNAAAANLANRQSLANANVGLRNQAKSDQVQAQKSLFDMNMAKATGQNAISNTMANNSIRQSGNANAGIGQIGQGIVQMAGTYANNQKPVAATPNNLNNASAWQQNDVTTQLVNDPTRYRA